MLYLPGHIASYKRDIGHARTLAQEGENVEALEILEKVFQGVNYWKDHEIERTGASRPEYDTLLRIIRQLAGQIRGQMAEHVLKGPMMGGFTMGLHTEAERNTAYRLAAEKVEWAERQGNGLAISNALGYLECLMDLAEDEVDEDDPNFLKEIQELYYRLSR